MKRGYTLAELLITFTILGVILALFIPTLFKGKIELLQFENTDKVWCTKYANALKVETEWHDGIGCIQISETGKRTLIREDSNTFHSVDINKSDNEFDKDSSTTYKEITPSWEE